VKGRLDLAVADLGRMQLKNIAEPVRVYSLEVGVLKRKPAPPSQTSATAAKPNRFVQRWLIAAVVLFAAAVAVGTYAWRSGLASRLAGGSTSEDKLASAPHLSIVVLP
jgi:hypothetical protein